MARRVRTRVVPLSALAAALAVVSVVASDRAREGAPTTYVGAPHVDAAFARGAALLETATFKVHASRREAPGEAEIHLRDTDVFHVLEGSATLVTGGTLVGGRHVAADEIRGTGIRGGDVRRIGRGDVVVVANGVPHWFQEVDGPVLYFVVKVTAPVGGSR